MKVIDPGHRYELSALDGDNVQTLQFVKRMGSPAALVGREYNKFPGNTSTCSGTTLQETLRACIDRVSYLDDQISDSLNSSVIYHLEQAILNLEARAALRHGRHSPTTREACYGAQCPDCLHVGCTGNCHTKDENK